MNLKSLLGLPAPIDHLHRRVVRVGAAAAWFCAAIFLSVGLVTGNDDLVVESLGPIVAATLMTAQIILAWEHGGVALLGSAGVVVVTYSIMANPTTLIAACLALVVISSLAMLFVSRWFVIVAAGVAIGLFLVPLFWSGGGFGSVQLGTIMALSFVMTATLFITIRSSAVAIDTKYRGMFEESPAALFDEDWSEAVGMVKATYPGRPEGLRDYLLERPDFLREVVARSSITRVNRAGVELIEAPSAEAILGYRNPARVPDGLLEPYADALVSLYEGRRVFERVYPFTTLGGAELWLQARCVNPAFAGGGNVLIAVADVTHAHDKQEALAQMVEAKDKFIASVSHELRTPLTAVVGLTSAMADPSMGPDEVAELTGLVSGQAKEMSHIIEDLLVASRGDMGEISVEIQDVELAEQVRAVVNSTGVEPISLPGSLPSVTADSGRVRQILRNLLTNVERYGGPQLRIMGGVTHRTAWIEVRDNGEGVPPEKAEAIFEPYTTAHPGVTGSVGLGLAVARQLAELMRGSLVYRRDGGETVFRLELPLANCLAGVS